MTRRSEQGIALVITLIMLSVVTFMTVVFLSVTRRERGSVKITQDQLDAQLSAEAALARVQAQVVSRMLASTNLLAYDLMVSTNYFNFVGFQPNIAHPTNVNEFYNNGTPISGNDYLQYIANLQYDARVPVFVETNDSGALDYRYFLDLNRNRSFEPTGSNFIFSPRGLFYDTNKVESANPVNRLMDYFIGDPQWIGLLERPEFPHSETNRFVGRYAFAVLPTGKSLDLNFIHNHASARAFPVLTNTPNNNGFFRNQGVGSWELNLAAFLRDLNTNAWPSYTFILNGFPAGIAFEDARALLAYRYAGNRNFLKPAQTMLNITPLSHFRNDYVDLYSDGPLFTFAFFNSGNVPPSYDDDNIASAWAGSPNINRFVDVQELFSRTNFSPEFEQFATLRLRPVMQVIPRVQEGSYNRYTFYRLLAQMGVDSGSGTAGKINLNYTNDFARVSTNFTDWMQSTNITLHPTNFFMNLANRLLRNAIFTNMFVSNRVTTYTNYYIGDTLVRPDISITNIQIFHRPDLASPWNSSNEYTAAIHRLLQVAANVQDTITNRGAVYPFLPSVFRPVFTVTPTNVLITGFSAETNAYFVTNTSLFAWRSVEELYYTNGAGFYPNVNVFGQPVVIGAKKGYPNFNEFSLETYAQVVRKLEFQKDVPGGPVLRTNQMYVLGISNVFGVEAWNSYTQTFNRPLEVHASIQYSMALSNVPNNFISPIRYTTGYFVTNIVFQTWPGNTNPFPNPASFKLPLFTNALFLADAAYSRFPPYFGNQNATNLFEPRMDPPEWQFYITNRVQFWIIDQATKALVDFVNIDRLTNSMNITRRLGDTNSAATQLFSDQTISPRDFWITNTLTVPTLLTPTIGITNQIGVSLGVPQVADSFWRDYNAFSVDKRSGIDFFRLFMGYPPSPGSTNVFSNAQRALLRHQAPFTPARKLYQRSSWQANDPLVHYLASDLTDPFITDPASTNNMRVIEPANQVLTNALDVSNLGKLNERYRPWGQANLKDVTNNRLAFDPSIKDPQVTRSDDWAFPTNILSSNFFKFPSIGWLGRIHRGTPWQTIYLKSAQHEVKSWSNWSGSLGTHPTNDWRMLDIFTAAHHENAAHGLLSVNQTNLAAWSAVLGGVAVLSNSLPDAAILPRTPRAYLDLPIQPSSPQLEAIVAGINSTRAKSRHGVFTNMGSILATPELSDRSPFLNLAADVQKQFAIDDYAYERIPQQILSLLKADEPRITVYAFGQALRPAERSIVTAANFYGLCTNYQVSGEVAIKAVLRVEGELDNPRNPIRTVVESYTVLPPE